MTGPPRKQLRHQDAESEVLSLVHVPEHFVLPMCIPTVQSGISSEERLPVDVVALGNFEEFLPVEIKPRLDYKVLGYRKFAVPPAAAYMRPRDDARHLRGALEEHSVRGPCGSATDGAEVPLRMPESCLLPPSHDAMSLLVPSTECRTYVALPDAAQCDPDFRLSQPPALLGPFASEALLPPDVMALEAPWLATWRPTRQIQDPWSCCDPVPACFAEGGGPFGPRLGCDAGGERINFLPVGGFANDLPSDTDDDECAEFHMPPPTDEDYQAALRTLDAPLHSERWKKELEVEERMQKRCAAANRAVRDRLVQLNADLAFGNKLYLG